MGVDATSATFCSTAGTAVLDVAVTTELVGVETAAVVPIAVLDMGVEELVGVVTVVGVLMAVGVVGAGVEGVLGAAANLVGVVGTPAVAELAVLGLPCGFWCAAARIVVELVGVVGTALDDGTVEEVGVNGPEVEPVVKVLATDEEEDVGVVEAILFEVVLLVVPTAGTVVAYDPGLLELIETSPTPPTPETEAEAAV